MPIDKEIDSLMRLTIWSLVSPLTVRIEADVAQDDDVVDILASHVDGLLPNLENLVVGEVDALDVVRVGLGGGVRGGQANHCDLEAVEVIDLIRLESR